MIARLHRYAIGIIDRDNGTFTIRSRHLLFHPALKEFQRQQKRDLESALFENSDWNEWGIVDLRTGKIVSLSAMVKAGYCTIRRS